jgi:transcriptional regulator with XRE-family HTH domain
MTQAKQGRALTRGERIKRLRLALGPLMDGVPNQAEFGVMVAKEERRAKGGYNSSTVHRWEEKEAAPDLSTIEAMARIAARHGIAYASRAWLAFGDDGVEEAVAAPAAPAWLAGSDGTIGLATAMAFKEIVRSTKRGQRAADSK